MTPHYQTRKAIQTMKTKQSGLCTAGLLALHSTMQSVCLAQVELGDPEPIKENCPCACEWDDQSGPFSCDIMDFLDFQNAFVFGNPCAIDKDTSTGNGVGDVFDFLVFQQEFISKLQGGC